MAIDHDDGKRGSALDKALAVLEAVCAADYPVGLPDLSAQLNLPRQTVHRVLKQLEDNGLLQRDVARDRYSIGPRMTRLALSAQLTSNQTSPIRTILKSLVDEIQETCNVGVLDGGEVVYVDRVECDWPLRVRLQAGSHVPAHCTAIGKLLLAHLPRATQRDLVSVLPMKAYTHATITDRDRLLEMFEQIKRDGYSSSDEEFAIGLMAVAVPVRDDRNRVIAALAVHAPVARLSVEAAVGHIPRLREAAKLLSQAFGFTGIAEVAA